MNKQYLSILETVGIALIGGLLFLLIHVPLPWLLGPLTAVTAWRLATGRVLYLPPIFFRIALLILGYMLGSSFTKETAVQIMQQLPFMAVSTTITVLVSLGLGVVTARCLNLDMASVVIGSVPGGLSQMVAISQEMKGIDPTVVVFTQVIRVLAVIFIVPFITIHGLGGDAAELPMLPTTDMSQVTNGHWIQYILYGLVSIVGYLFGNRIGLPNSILTGPLVATAVVMIIGDYQAPHLPSLIIILSQLAIGINIGLMAQPEILHNVKTFGVYTVMGSILLIVSSLLLAWGLTIVTPMTLATGFLSTAPGGIAEMGITATLVHADLSMVSGYQLFRMLFILFIVTPFLQRWIRRENNPIEEIPRHRNRR